jgi:hypothetical protein
MFTKGHKINLGKLWKIGDAHKNKWSKEEEQIVIKDYKRIGATGLTKVLKKRSRLGIVYKAFMLGIKYNRKGIKNFLNRKEKNGQWKGNNVSKNPLHQWIKRYKPKILLCECCNTNKSYDLANISQEYKRELNDWEWLCRKCHMTKDKRLLALAKVSNSRKLKNIYCLICGKNFHPKLSITKYCSKVCYYKSEKKL